MLDVFWNEAVNLAIFPNKDHSPTKNTLSPKSTSCIGDIHLLLISETEKQIIMETMKNKNSVAFGIILASIGVLLLLNNLIPDEIPFRYYIFSWKTLLIAIGLALITFRKHYTGGLIVASIGVIFWLPELFGHQFAVNQIILPAILVITGIVLLMKAAGLDNNYRNKKFRKHGFTAYEEVKTAETTDQK